jgi:hypothetical protein
MLDGIFADCYSRWGGRFSLIVPCEDGEVCDQYWPWLEVFDPDVVYSYVDLPKKTVIEIHERLVPADYIVHKLGKPPRLDVHGLRPQYGFTALSSLSTIFRRSRYSKMEEGEKLKIIDSWHTEKPTRFLSDNFGTYGQSAATGSYPNDARPAATLLTIVSEKYSREPSYGIPRDLDRIESEGLAFTEVLAKRATTMSMLSSLFAPRLEISDRRWSTAFNLVIGDSFEDRLLFWNARLLIPAWLDADLCCFRASLDDLKDEDTRSQLIAILKVRNHVNDGGGQPLAQIRSASHSAAELDEVRKLLHAKAWGVRPQVEIVGGGHVIPSTESLHRAREVSQVLDVELRTSQWQEYRWTHPVARPPAISPEHLADAPSDQSFTTGLWAVDLSLEYSADISGQALQNVWMLPKRWRMSPAFIPSFRHRSRFSNSIPPTNRTSRHGNLTVFSGFNQMLDSIVVPSIAQAIHTAFCSDSANKRLYDGDPVWPSPKAAWIKASNEAPYLNGILGMAGGLPSSKTLILHPFFQELFAELGGAPNLSDGDVEPTVNALIKRTKKGRPEFDLRSEADRTVLADLIVKAGQSMKTPKAYISLESIQEKWAAYRTLYWESHPKPVSSESEVREWMAEEVQALEQRLAQMREYRLIFQGFSWKCESCFHRNWTDFQSLASTVPCDVCRTQASLPVDIPWHFRPNEFLIESLRFRSVLSVLWALAALSDRARGSFMYLGPTCLGYSEESDNPSAEMDLLAVVDGEAIICEVKSAWRSLRPSHLKDFVAQAKHLKPDRAVLAVMEDGNRLADEIAAATAELATVGIRFELLTTSKYRVDDDPFLFG